MNQIDVTKLKSKLQIQSVEKRRNFVLKYTNLEIPQSHRFSISVFSVRSEIYTQQKQLVFYNDFCSNFNPIFRFHLDYINTIGQI
jgi:hypothetical protein